MWLYCSWHHDLGSSHTLTHIYDTILKYLYDSESERHNWRQYNSEMGIIKQGREPYITLKDQFLILVFAQADRHLKCKDSIPGQHLVPSNHNSYFVSSISEWNKLDIKLKTAKSLTAFKHRMRNNFHINIPLFNHTTSWSNQIIFAPMHLGFSNLNDHLSHKGYIITSTCLCGAPVDDISHFLFICANVSEIRYNMLANIREIIPNVKPPKHSCSSIWK